MKNYKLPPFFSACSREFEKREREGYFVPLARGIKGVILPILASPSSDIRADQERIGEIIWKKKENENKKVPLQKNGTKISTTSYKADKIVHKDIRLPAVPLGEEFIYLPKKRDKIAWER